MTASKVDCKLFIEGHSIPFNMINISASEGQPSMATISLPPDENVKLLYPRSHVMVVFRDDYGIWRLLWDGEFRGWGMSKSAGGSSMQITAVDYSNAFSYMSNYIIGGYNHAQTNIEAIFQTGSPIQFEGKGSGTFVELINSFFKDSDEDDFATLMIRLLSNIFERVPYFTTSNIANRLPNRIISLPDENIKRILTNDLSALYLKSVVNNQFKGNTSFDIILNYFLQVAGYTRVPFICPPSFNGVPIHMLLKPSVYFSTPPCCNCFFPGMYTSNSGLSVDYLSEPTRIMLQTQQILGANVSKLFFFNEKFDIEPSTSNKESLVKDMLSSSELDKGILPTIRPVPFERAALIRDNTDLNVESMNNSMMAYAWYEFVNEKYGRRQTSITSGFNPYCVIGFPGAIFDRQQTLFGNIYSITHSISAEGSASTVVSFSHVYPASLSDENHLTSPPIPNWVSDKYKPAQANATYASLFGTNLTDDKHAAVGGDNPVTSSARRYDFSDDNQFNISATASSVFTIPVGTINSIVGLLGASNQGEALYDTIKGDKTAFERAYTYRNIISSENYLKFMGIEGDVGNDIIGTDSDLYRHPSDVEYIDDSYEVKSSNQRKFDSAALLQRSLMRSDGQLGF